MRGCQEARNPATSTAITAEHSSLAAVADEFLERGNEAHAKFHWVSRHADGATPQPARKMTYKVLLLFMVK